MDEQTRKRLDSVLEDELQRGYRIKELPENLQKYLEHECGVAVSRVRFTRLNPARRRKIAQVVQRQYHKDLQNPDILSHEQIVKLVEDRGEWSTALDEEMQRLQQTTSREMGDLFVDGMAQDSWSSDLMDAASTFRSKCTKAVSDEEKRKEILDRFDRWLEFSPDRKDWYTEKHAASQNRETYSADYDLQRLLEAVPDLEAVEALNTIDDLRERLYRYVKLQRDRLRLAELQLKHARIFSESVEQRRDNTEEMARLYFTTERLDEQDKPIGFLVSEFETLWDFPEPVIQWFLVEAYFFLNGIPDEAREYLQTFGFIAADAGKETISQSGESAPSGESPAPPTSKPEANHVEETAFASSE
jgi:tetratricopeptide (TPR) repeat protein